MRLPNVSLKFTFKFPLRGTIKRNKRPLFEFVEYGTRIMCDYTKHPSSYYWAVGGSSTHTCISYQLQGMLLAYQCSGDPSYSLQSRGK